jgi:cytochrome c peroxidase
MTRRFPITLRLGGALNLGVALAVLVSMTMNTSIASAHESGPVDAIKVDAKKAALGKRLFFDKRLSGDASQSCATCHIPEKAFSDGLALSKAYPGSEGFRNTPTLINVAHKASWFHDGHLGTNLNDVTRESITEDYVMNMDMRIMQERVKQDPVYLAMFKDAGYGEPSNGSVRKAIPEYLKTLTSRGAPFDTGNMSDAAKRGSKVFHAKKCDTCHTGTRFQDDKPHNTAVPNNPDIWSDPMRHHTYVAFGLFMGIENIFNIRRDVGAAVRTHKADGSDIGAFMTPTLRELKYTAPYMHNGTIKTLADVVAFYNNGGGDDPNKDPAMKPLGMSAGDQADLVAYLESLSGDPLTSGEHVWKDKIPANYTAIADWLKTPN